MSHAPKIRKYEWPASVTGETPFSGSDPTIIETVKEGKNPSPIRPNGVFFRSPGIVHRVPDFLIVVLGHTTFGDELHEGCLREEKPRRITAGTAESCLIHFLGSGEHEQSVFKVRTKEWMLLRITEFAVSYREEIQDNPHKQTLVPDSIWPLVLHTHFAETDDTTRRIQTRRLAWRRRCGLWWMDTAMQSIQDAETKRVSAFLPPSDDSDRSIRTELMALTMFFFADASFFHHQNHGTVTTALYNRFIEGVYADPAPYAWESKTLYAEELFIRGACWREVDEKSALCREVIRAWRERDPEKITRFARPIAENPRMLELAAIVSLPQCLFLANGLAQQRQTAGVGVHRKRIQGVPIPLEDLFSVLAKGFYSELERLSRFVRHFEPEALIVLEFSDTRIDAASLRTSMDSSLCKIFPSSRVSAPLFVVFSYSTGGRSRPVCCLVASRDALRACNLAEEYDSRYRLRGNEANEFKSGTQWHSIGPAILDAFFHSDSTMNSAARYCMADDAVSKIPKESRLVSHDSMTSSDVTKHSMHPLLSAREYRIAWGGLSKKLCGHVDMPFRVCEDGRFLLPSTRSFSTETRSPAGMDITLATDSNSLVFDVSNIYSHSIGHSVVRQVAARSIVNERHIQTCLTRWTPRKDTREFFCGGLPTQTLPKLRPTARISSKYVDPGIAAKRATDMMLLRPESPAESVVTLAEPQYEPLSVTAASAPTRTVGALSLRDAGDFQVFDPLAD